MDVQKIKQILRSYLSGKTTGKENDQVNQWYDSFDSDQTIELEARKEETLHDEMWRHIEAEVSQAGQGTSSSKHLYPFWIKVAAIFLLVTVASLLFFRRSTNRSETASVEIATKAGERKNVRMADGTLLVLKGGSEIRIQKDLSSERKVEIIDGEVFFDVKRDPKRPFIIKSGKMTTKVLGTAFTISAYKELSSISVDVTRGKVSVAAEDKILKILPAGTQLTYKKHNNTYKVTRREQQAKLLQEPSLRLSDASFDEMAILMMKNFGVKIDTEDEEIRTLTRYTTELSGSVEAIEAVEILAAIHNLKIRNIGTHYYFSKD